MWGARLNPPLTVANGFYLPLSFLDLPEKNLGQQARRRCRVGFGSFFISFHGRPHSHGSFPSIFSPFWKPLLQATPNSPVTRACLGTLHPHELDVLKDKKY